MLTRRARRIALALACIVLPHTAAAQTVIPGARVRVVDVQRRTAVLTGELIRTAGDTVTILTTDWRTGATQTVLVVGAQHRLEVSAGTHRSTGRGIGLGFLVGAAIGGVVGITSQPTGGILDPGRGGRAVAAAVLLGVPGMVIGGMVGHATKVDDWRPADRLPVRVGIAPSSRGVLLTASFAF